MCLQMVLAYFNDPVSYEQLKQDLEVDEVGTYAPQMGKYLLDKGYRVEITGLNPALFMVAEKGASPDLVLARIKEKLTDKKMSARQIKTLHYFLDFLSAGGKLNVQIPGERYIQESLEQNIPVIALLTSNFLFKKPQFNFHFNVITGLTGNRITVNDPLDDDRGGEHVYDHKDYLYAIYTTVFGDLDNGTLLKFWKE